MLIDERHRKASVTQEHERNVKNAWLRAVRAKARVCGHLHPSLKAQVYTHLFAQVYERGVKKAMLRAVRAKARVGVCLHPSLKALCLYTSLKKSMKRWDSNQNSNKKTSQKD